MIELLVNLLNPILKLQHALLPLKCYEPKSAPQLLLFLLSSLFGLAIESIKVLGGTSSTGY